MCFLLDNPTLLSQKQYRLVNKDSQDVYVVEKKLLQIPRAKTRSGKKTFLRKLRKISISQKVNYRCRLFCNIFATLKIKFSEHFRKHFGQFRCNPS